MYREDIMNKTVRSVEKAKYFFKVIRVDNKPKVEAVVITTNSFLANSFSEYFKDYAIVPKIGIASKTQVKAFDESLPSDIAVLKEARDFRLALEALKEETGYVGISKLLNPIKKLKKKKVKDIKVPSIIVSAPKVKNNKVSAEDNTGYLDVSNNKAVLKAIDDILYSEKVKNLKKSIKKGAV